MKASLSKVFLEIDGIVAVEANHYANQGKGALGDSFIELKEYGKTGIGMKVLPNTAAYQPQSCSQGAWLEYRCYVEQEGEYDLTFFMAPTLPVTSESHIWIGCQINDGQVVCEDTVECLDELYFNKAQHVRETINDVK